MNFALKYFKAADAIATKYHADPGHVYAFQCEIAAAGYVYEQGQAGYREIEIGLDSLKQSSEGAMAFLLVKGAVAEFKEKGINGTNIRGYMDKRIQEFEDMARAAKEKK